MIKKWTKARLTGIFHNVNDNDAETHDEQNVETQAWVAGDNPIRDDQGDPESEPES